MYNNSPNKMYFKIIELPRDRYGRIWKMVVDKTNVSWGIFLSYKSAKQAISIFKKKYVKDLEKRGYFEN